MKCPWILAALLLFGVGCRDQHTNAAQKAAPPPAAPAVVQQDPHGFKVNITLSEKARQTLVQSKETIIVAGYASGTPKQGALKKYVNEMGTINLGEIRAEIAPGESASFGDVALLKDHLEQTDGQDPELLINVFSGRKSSENNLLDCGIYQGGLHALQGHATDISCKLIGEP